ncbi:MAG: hypothetical protein AB7P03_00605 [Kofleriaceae bacterium]
MEIDSWLAEQIEAHAPERESDPAAAARLAEAYAALANAAQQAFGLAIPAEVPDRERLRTRALELLKQWLAKLDPEHKEKIRAQMAGYGLPVSRPLPSTLPPPPENKQE